MPGAKKNAGIEDVDGRGKVKIISQEEADAQLCTCSVPSVLHQNFLVKFVHLKFQVFEG